MEQFRVPRLLAGALAAVTGAVVASFFGVEGTLIGAALGSILVTPAEAVYTRTLASADTLARRSLLRRVGEEAGPSEEGASKAHPEPIRWRRVAVAAVLAFGIAVGAITGMEAVAQQPLASLFGSRPRQGASTSVGVVVAEADRPAPPASRAPATPTTSPSRPAPTTTVAVPTTTAPVAVPTTTAPAGTVPNTTAAATTTPSSHTPTTGTP
jgi:hypothetical protein